MILKECNGEKLILKVISKMIKRIYQGLYKRICAVKWRLKLVKFGNKSLIYKPLYITGGGEISIGSRVCIQKGAWLAATGQTGSEHPRLEIGDGCVIGHYNEIYATKSIILEPNVLTADRVYISDNLHGYEDIDTPILRQPIKQIGTVRIGEGSWLGVGVSVIGANIGKHCVIGANAVVTHDIPDYSVAVGIPARVIKRYNPETTHWERTNPDGSFIK